MIQLGELYLFIGIDVKSIRYIPASKYEQNYTNDPWGDDVVNYLEKTGIYSFKLASFKFVEGYIDIPKQNIPTDRELPELFYINYAAIKPSPTKILFYFVNSIEFLPDRCRLYITIDNWMSYIGYADIKKVHFTRSNIQLNKRIEDRYRIPEYKGVYDVYEYDVSAFGNANRISRDSLQLYAVIKHRTYQSRDKLTEIIRTYYFDIRDIVGKTNTSMALTASDIQSACEWVASIYSCVIDYGGGITNEGDAEVMHLYLFDKSIQNAPSTQLGNYKFNGIKKGVETTVTGWEVNSSNNKYRSVIYNGNDENYQPITPIFPGDETPTPGAFVSSRTLGGIVYFGTKTNGIKLPPFAGCLTVALNVQVLNDRILFLVEADGEQRDITECFELVIVANTASLTSQQSLAKSVNNIANIAGGAVQILTGGVSGAISGTARIGAVVADNTAQGNGSYIGGGSGWETMLDIINNGSGEYLFIRWLNPELNLWAESYLNNYGAECNYDLIKDGSTTFNEEFFTHINSCPYLSVGKAIMIQCESTVTGLPDDAANEIQDILLSGVKLSKIPEA